MASSSMSGSSNPFGTTERTRSIDGAPSSLKSNVESESMAEKKFEKGEQFLASDNFYQRMEAMINKEDVQSILDKQKETLTKFEKTNAKFGRFNDLSAARFLHLNQQLKNYTKMLLDMKKDLDSVFRRIRTLKAKLAKQYGPAFHAISAGIQKLEEELGASIENEDTSSLGTLTESQEFSCKHQATNQQLAVGHQAVDQITEEGVNQEEPHPAMCSSTSESGKSNDQPVENRPAAESDIVVTKIKEVEISLESEDTNVENLDKEFKTQDTDNGSLREASSVQKNQDTIGTVDTDEASRTLDTSDMIQTVDTDEMSGTVDTNEIISHEGSRHR